MKRIFNIFLVGVVLAIFQIQSPSAIASSSSEKKESNAPVVFRDGSVIAEDELKAALDQVPQQLSNQMTLSDLKQCLSFHLAYKKVMKKVVAKSPISKSKKVKDAIEKRKVTAAGLMLQDEAAEKAMEDKEDLKKHYDKMWEANFKDTEEYSLLAITTSDLKVAKKIEQAEGEAEVKNILDAHSGAVKFIELKDKPEAMFPPEVVKDVKKKGVNSVIGPFKVRGVQMFFVVEDIHPARKQEFEVVAENYKKIAKRDFTAKVMEGFYVEYDVKIFGPDGKPIDPFKIIPKDPKKEDKSKPLDFSKVKDDFVTATVDGEKITIKQVKLFFHVESFLDDSFLAMAQQFKIRPDQVALYAVKLVVDDAVLAKKVKKLKFNESPKVREKLEIIEDMELTHAYLKEDTKVTNEDIKETFSSYMKAIPEEDKNDHEISVKLVLFETQEDANAALKSIKSGEKKFSFVFKQHESKGAKDLGYVKKRETSPEFWGILKTGASGTCSDQVAAIDGAIFGFDGMNYAIIYIADRRPVTLPKLSDPGVKNQFKALAQRKKAVELIKADMKSEVETVNGQSIEEIEKANPERLDRTLDFCMGYVPQ
ncbi:MAG: hypothetical protein LBE97_02570 [Holosporales bacterium]|jgi:hypothetical protein|nr:hypothetical protein [Holosporales bacterium]